MVVVIVVAVVKWNEANIASGQRGASVRQRSSYPLGFLVVGVVRGSSVACRGEPARDQDWLWEAAVWGQRDPDAAEPTTKHITFTVQVLGCGPSPI